MIAAPTTGGPAPGILVTGGSGQLATALGRAAPHAVRVVGRPTLDFDRPDTLNTLFAGRPPAILVNAAAWTAVDAAETEPEAARRANTDAPGHLARLCRDHGTRLIHISTDYVFDGSKRAPYTEDDPTSPTGVYGATKLAGERAVEAACPDAVILRTAWVYAETGRNFVRTMLNAARKVSALRVVADQRGCPTNADDLAQAILAVAAALVPGVTGDHGTADGGPNPAAGDRPTATITARQAGPGHASGGLYHATGSGDATWHGFATAIFEAAAPFGWPTPTVEPIATADWPTPARRPADSRLDCSKLQHEFGVRLPDWRPSLHRAVASICSAMAPV